MMLDNVFPKLVLIKLINNFVKLLMNFIINWLIIIFKKSSFFLLL